MITPHDSSCGLQYRQQVFFLICIVLKIKIKFFLFNSCLRNLSCFFKLLGFGCKVKIIDTHIFIFYDKKSFLLKLFCSCKCMIRLNSDNECRGKKRKTGLTDLCQTDPTKKTPHVAEFRRILSSAERWLFLMNAESMIFPKVDCYLFQMRCPTVTLLLLKKDNSVPKTRQQRTKSKTMITLTPPSIVYLIWQAGCCQYPISPYKKI